MTYLAPTSPLVGLEPFCVYSGTGDYRITIASTNGTGTFDAINGSDVNALQYTVRVDDTPALTTPIAVTENVHVPVSHGAVTEVNFLTELQFGVAGRVTREDGSFVARSKLWILDEDGNTRVSTYTDQFGLYRADGLTPGRYRVEVVGDDAEIVS
ncbi:MAG: carboxypeptidase regulatory-like domain-containing protein, partial [Gammaproteobacteria bacterium]